MNVVDDVMEIYRECYSNCTVNQDILDRNVHVIRDFINFIATHPDLEMSLTYTKRVTFVPNVMPEIKDD
jgi:hypothetical protein